MDILFAMTIARTHQTKPGTQISSDLPRHGTKTKPERPKVSFRKILRFPSILQYGAG